MRAAKHLNRLENDPTYLYVIARNLIVSSATRARPETPVLDLPAMARLQADSPLEEDPERAALLAQNHAKVKQALELRYFGELDSAVIGEVVGRTPVPSTCSRVGLASGCATGSGWPRWTLTGAGASTSHACPPTSTAS